MSGRNRSRFFRYKFSQKSCPRDNSSLSTKEGKKSKPISSYFAVQNESKEEPQTKRRRVESNKKKLQVFEAANGSTEDEAAVSEKFASIKDATIEVADQNNDANSKEDEKVKKLTPLEEQVVDLGKKHPGLLLMVECGYRYRFFGPDATAASAALDISAHADSTGSGRLGLTASVPTFNGPSSYVSKLVSAGHKVGLVTQTESAASKKVKSTKSPAGPFQRAVTGVFTAATLIDHVSSQDSSQTIVALASKAVASITPLNGRIMYDTLDNVQQRLAAVEPTDIILLGGDDHGMSREVVLCYVAEQKAAGKPARFETVSKDDLASQDGLLCSSFGPTLAEIWPSLSGPVQDCIQLLHVYLLQFGLERSLLHATCVEPMDMVNSSNSRMKLPAATIKNLEVLSTSCGGQNGTLLHCLDCTLTRPGKRLFRSWLTSPLQDQEAIEGRLNSVEYLANCAELYVQLKTILGKNYYDFELSLASALNRRLKPSDFVRTCTTLHRLAVALAEMDHDVKKCPAVLNKILTTVVQSFSVAKSLLDPLDLGAASRSDVEGLFKDASSSSFPDLEECRVKVDEIERLLEEHKTDIRKTLGLLNFNYTTVSGIEYLVEVKNGTTVPQSWTKMSATQRVWRFRTPFVDGTLPKLQWQRERLEAASQKAWIAYLDSSLASIRSLMVGARSLATLDVLFSLATVAKREGFCRPTFSTDGLLDIKQGRNVIVENVLMSTPGKQFVPNDAKLDLNNGPRALVLTGPNMGGKSCYLRQLGIMALIAQIGSFVPASEATLPLFDAIYVRLGARDDLAAGKSTLMMELEEASAILNGATSRSLVLLDELGRGTSTHDGTAVAAAALKHLLDRIQCMTLFVTHYKSLTKQKSCWLSNGHMGYSKDEENDDVLFMYSLCPGPSANSFGINVAKMAGLPAEIVARASKIANAFESPT